MKMILLLATLSVLFLFQNAYSMNTEDFLNLDLAKKRVTRDGSLVIIAAISNEMITDPDRYELNWLFGAMLFFYGEIYETSPEAKKILFTRSKDYSLKAISINSNDVDAHYWLGVAYGKWAEANGILDSLFYADDIAREMTFVIERDPDFFFGIPYAIRATVYNFAPGWPLSVGDKKKSYRDIETAMKKGKKFRLIYQLYAEILINDGHYEKALEVINQGLALEPDLKVYVKEDAKTVQDLKRVLKNLKTKMNQ